MENIEKLRVLELPEKFAEGSFATTLSFIDIEEAISALGEITGLTVSEEIVDRIFHSFCIGK